MVASGSAPPRLVLVREQESGRARAYAWLHGKGLWGESNAGLVVGRGDSLLVDTQLDAEHGRVMLKAMEPYLRKAPLQAVVLTHQDPDHAWGFVRAAADSGCQVISSGSAAGAMKQPRAWRLRVPGLLGLALTAAALNPFLNPGIRRTLRRSGNYLTAMFGKYDFSDLAPRVPSQTFSGELRLIGGAPVGATVGGAAGAATGIELRLLELGPAHTTGDVAVFVPDLGLVFCGDLLFCGVHPVCWEPSLARWAAGLGRLLELDADLYVPGHGPIGGPGEVRLMRDYLLYLLEALGELLRSGFSPRKATLRLLNSESFRTGPHAGLLQPERVAIAARAVKRELGIGRSSGPLEELRGLMDAAWVAARLESTESK